MVRSSRSLVFCKKSILRNFTKFTGKYLCQSLFFNKVAVNGAANLHFFYKIVNGLTPKYTANYLNINDIQVYKTRASKHNNIKRFRTRT